MTRFIPVFALLVAAGPAFAQAGATQTPPAPNSGSSEPQTSNSLPAGAANMNTNSVANPNLAGQAVGGTTTQPGVTTTTPARP